MDSSVRDVRSNLVVKNNDLMDGRSLLSLNEQRVIFLAISKLDSRKPANENPKTLILVADEFARVFGLRPNNAYVQLREGVQHLFERTAEIQHAKGKVQKIRWLQAQAMYQDGDGRVEIMLSDPIMPYLTDLSGHHSATTLGFLGRLSTQYAQCLYERLHRWIKKGDAHGWARYTDIDDFKFQLGVDDKYPRWEDFKKFILRPCLAQIEKRTNLRAEFKPLKTGRRVTGIYFDIYRQEVQVEFPF